MCFTIAIPAASMGASKSALWHNLLTYHGLRHVIQPNLVLAEVYSLTLVPMDTEAQALIQILQSILDH